LMLVQKPSWQLWLVLQAAQTFPAAPHAVLAKPDWQDPALSQQPLGQVEAEHSFFC
jgi:hypothetical protein